MVQVQAPEGFHAIIIGSGISGIAMGRKFNLMGIK
jgi:cation diffusion facilitator CzcD-associated flavoprotein CzcO